MSDLMVKMQVIGNITIEYVCFICGKPADADVMYASKSTNYEEFDIRHIRRQRETVEAIYSCSEHYEQAADELVGIYDVASNAVPWQEAWRGDRRPVECEHPWHKGRFAAKHYVIVIHEPWGITVGYQCVKCGMETVQIRDAGGTTPRIEKYVPSLWRRVVSDWRRLRSSD